MLQVQRQLDADVVQLAEAERQAREEQARGDAAVVVERGKAEAEALKAVLEAFAIAGEGAREVLALQQVIPLLSRVAGADHPLSVHKVTVLPGADAAGPETASPRPPSARASRIKAATGVDLAGIARKLGGPA